MCEYLWSYNRAGLTNEIFDQGLFSIYHRFIVYTPNYFLAWREFDEISKEIVAALRLFDEKLALES
jgi:hypothetical protein